MRTQPAAGIRNGSRIQTGGPEEQQRGTPDSEHLRRPNSDGAAACHGLREVVGTGASAASDRVAPDSAIVGSDSFHPHLHGSGRCAGAAADDAIRHWARGRCTRSAASCELSIQVLGVLLILLVIFGTPHQMPTILGLATAGTHHRAAGLHSRVFRLVRSHGQERHSRGRLGRDQRRRRRGNRGRPDQHHAS